MTRRVMLDGKIRWRARRSMLELDVLLTRFLESVDFDNLPEGQKTMLLTLLEADDFILWGAIVNGLDRVHDPLLTTMRRYLPGSSEPLVWEACPSNEEIFRKSGCGKSEEGLDELPASNGRSVHGDGQRKLS